MSVLSGRSLARRMETAQEHLEVARDADSPPEALAALVRRSKRDPELQRALAANPNTPPVALRRLSRSPRWDVRASVAAHPATDDATLHDLTLDEAWPVRATLAERVQIPPRLLDFPSWSPHVRFALAGNPNVPPDRLERLLRDDDVYVRGRAAGNPSAPVDALRTLAGGMTEAPWVLRAIAANPRCPDDLADELFTWMAVGGAGRGDPTFDPVECEGNPVDASAPPWAFNVLAARDPDASSSVLWSVRAQITTSLQRIPIHVIERLAADRDPRVRRTAARFSEIPTDVLEELTGDADPQTSRLAGVSLVEHRLRTRAQRRPTRTTRVTRAVMTAILIAVVLPAVNGRDGPIDGLFHGNSSDEAADRIIEDFFSGKPLVTKDLDTRPPGDTTTVGNDHIVRTEVVPGSQNVRVWLEAGRTPLAVALAVDTNGQSFPLDGYRVPARHSRRLVLQPASARPISSITVTTPEESAVITIGPS